MKGIKKKKQLLEYINGFVIKLDNGVRLNLSIREKDFYESKFENMYVTLKNIDMFGNEEIIDDHGLKNVQYKRMLTIDSRGVVYGFDYFGNTKDDMNEDKKISKYMSDARCAIDLLRPFNQIDISEEIRKRNNNSKEELFEFKKEQLEKQIVNTSLEYSSLVKKCEFVDLEKKRFYNKIPITEDELFERDVDGVLRIKSFFIDYLKYFNLNFIDFKDVDVRGIDFTNCNAYSLKPNEVYKGLDKCIIPLSLVGESDFSWNVKGVSLYGTEFVSDSEYDLAPRFYPSSFADAKVYDNTKFPEQMKEYIDSIKEKYKKEENSDEIDLDDTLELFLPSLEDLPIKTQSRSYTDKEQELLDEVAEKEIQSKKVSEDLIRKTKNTLITYLDSLDEYSSLGESTKCYYNKLYVNEELLYEKNKDGILCVREELRKYLKYFDLYKFTFDGVDISNLDFTDCNLGCVMIDKVVRAENCRIPGELIGPSWNFDGVNIKGADLSFSSEYEKLRNQFIFNNLDKAIVDYSTILPDREIPKKEKSEIKLTLGTEEYEPTISLFDDDYENESSNGMKR